MTAVSKHRTQFVFGPVPSRRLGRSLGIDLVPLKTCSLDCVYCQLGRTTSLTIRRGRWVDVDAVVEQLADRLDSNPDWITLSGSGEPTLHADLAALIERIKKLTDVPVAVLTNGTLLHRRDLREELHAIDLLVPSLDAGDDRTFARVNRPHPGLSFEQAYEGLIAARADLPAEFWLEVFLVPGLNDTGRPLDALVAAADRVGADRVQLNTATRPPAESFVRPLPEGRLREIAGLFNPAAEIAADFAGHGRSAAFAASREQILAMLQRRPCRPIDLADGLGMHVNEVLKHLRVLRVDGRIEPVLRNGATWYHAHRHERRAVK